MLREFCRTFERAETPESMHLHTPRPASPEIATWLPFVRDSQWANAEIGINHLGEVVWLDGAFGQVSHVIAGEADKCVKAHLGLVHIRHHM